MSTKQSRLLTRHPYLIQRCTLDRADKKLLYELVGSSEFEVGLQASSLKRMFAGEIEMGACAVRAFDRYVEFCIVARKGFPFGEYARVIQGLINQEWGTQEPTYLDDVLKKNLRLAKTDVKTEVWFDFTNDALFTLSVANAHSIVFALINIKEVWRKKDEWRNSPPVKKFREELEEIKANLQKAGKHWFSLEDIEDVGGELKVWLNPMGQEIYTHHWCTLQDLRDWLKNKGPIMKEQNKSERIGK